MASNKPVIHGRDHMPGGADPIPFTLGNSLTGWVRGLFDHTGSGIGAAGTGGSTPDRMPFMGGSVIGGVTEQIGRDVDGSLWPFYRTAVDKLTGPKNSVYWYRARAVFSDQAGVEPLPANEVQVIVTVDDSVTQRLDGNTFKTTDSYSVPGTIFAIYETEGILTTQNLSGVDPTFDIYVDVLLSETGPIYYGGTGPGLEGSLEIVRFGAMNNPILVDDA